jgi:hypothetical protein
MDRRQETQGEPEFLSSTHSGGWLRPPATGSHDLSASVNLNRFGVGVFCISPRKGIFQTRPGRD